MKTYGIPIALLATVILAHAESGAAPLAEKRPPPVPPITALRLSSELLAGFGAGIAGAYVCGVIGHRFGEDFWYEGNFLSDADRNAAIGILIGYHVFTPLGVYLAGSAGDQTGSFTTSLFSGMLGSMIGAVAAYGMAERGYGEAGRYVLIFGAPVGAVAGFTLTRRWDDEAPLACLDATGGRVAFGAPSVTMRASPVDGAVRREIAIVRARF